jgi:hypothetical protein
MQQFDFNIERAGFSPALFIQKGSSSLPEQPERRLEETMHHG